MRFSENGYYIERYVKCANCGMLIYNEGLPGRRHDADVVFCSPWCIEWAGLRDAEMAIFACRSKRRRRPGRHARRRRTW